MELILFFKKAYNYVNKLSLEVLKKEVFLQFINLNIL